ncbi:ATP-dependent DNA helicase [Salix suchowensis]|nr:ATP-dependent DNA helicase [Salix suchowensis]
MLWRRHTFKYTIPEEFVDDWTNDTRGFSWCTDPAHPNQPHPFAKEHQLLEILINDPHLKLFTRGPNNTLIPNPAAILSILEQCQKINLQLAIYTYLTAGASPRASESVEFKITNGLEIEMSSTTVVTFGWLQEESNQKAKKDMKTLSLSNATPDYQSFSRCTFGIRPMERQLARLVWNEEVGQLYDTQLWIHNKQVMKSDYFSNCLGTMMDTYCQVKDCKVRAWRQLSVAMGRMYLGNTFEVDLEEGSILAAQRSHSIQVERVHYAPEEGHLPSLSSDTLLQYGLASEAWARMLGCYPNQPLLVPILLQKRQQLFTSPSTSLAISQSSTQTATQLLDTNHLAVTLAQSLAVQMAKLQEGMKHQINIAVATAVEKAMLNIPGHMEHHFNHHQLDLAPPSNQLQLPPMTTILIHGGPAFQLLRALFNNQKATFKSPMQRHLVELSLARENNFIAVLPTGGGKSLIYQLAGLKDAGTNFKTVVVVPCKALLQDQLNKAIRLGIPCIKYVVNSSGLLPAGYSRASLIFVALETAVTSNFRLFNNAEEFIVRLVIDEAHLAMTQQEFREPFSKLKGLSDLSVQKIWLTATLPPSKEKLLKEELGARPSTPVLRIPTPQPLIGYHHILIDPNTCAFLDYIEAIMNKIHITYMLPEEKAIIFVQSINDAKYLAPKFGNLVSHSSMESSEKMENEHRWMTGQDHWCIVATTGMIHGVDHPAVSAVIFAGFPYNIINMIQGAGRGGRGGNKAIAVVVEQHRVNITMVGPKQDMMSDHLQPYGWHPSYLSRPGSNLPTSGILQHLQPCISIICRSFTSLFYHEKGKAKAILKLPPTPPQPIQMSSNSDDEYDLAFPMEQLANLDFSQIESHHRSSSQSTIPSLPVWIHSTSFQGSHYSGQPSRSAQSQTRRHSAVSRKGKTSSLSRSYTNQQHFSANPSLPVLMDVAYAQSLKEMKNKKAIILNEFCNKLNGNCKACWVLGKENVTPPCSKPFIDCRVDDQFSQLGFGWIGLRKLVDLPGTISTATTAGFLNLPKERSPGFQKVIHL